MHIHFFSSIFNENGRLNRHQKWAIKTLISGQGWGRPAGQWLWTPFSSCCLCHVCCYTKSFILALSKTLYTSSTNWFRHCDGEHCNIQPWMFLITERCLASVTVQLGPGGIPGQREHFKIADFLLACPRGWIWIHLIHGSGSQTRASWMQNRGVPTEQIWSDGNSKQPVCSVWAPWTIQ